MKTTINKTTVTLAIICLCLTGKESFAQCSNVISATISETSTIGGCSSISSIAGSSASGWQMFKTGNDIRYSSSTGGIMIVNVWDGANAGLGWDDATGNACNTSLPSGTVGADVVVVESYSRSQSAITWFAIVAHADASNNCYCTIYEWNLFSGIFNSTPFSQTTLTGRYGTAINVDADASGNFVIIWDDAGAGDIKIQGGYTSATAEPQLCSSAQSVPNTSGCTWPDVSLYTDATYGTYAYYTYIINYNLSSCTSILSYIFVGKDSYSSICSGTVGNTNMLTNAASNTYYYLQPRIACPPNINGATLDEFMVAVAYLDLCNNITDVMGITMNSSGTFYRIYTDGGSNSPSSTPLQTAHTYPYPVVSYDQNHTGAMVGWYTKYASCTWNPPIAIAVNCDLNGALNSSCTNASNNYFLVPSNSSTSYVTGLSISGRDNNSSGTLSMLYTFYDYTTTDILYKTVDYCNSGGTLRVSDSDSKQQTVFPNPFTDELKISFGFDYARINVLDVTGKVLLNAFGNEAVINKELSSLAKELSQGIYMLKLESDTGEITNQKLIKM